MKITKLILSTLAFAILMTLAGCSHSNGPNDNVTAPAPPKNIYTVSKDNKVEIYWDKNIERDVIGYDVWWAYTYNGKYTKLGSTPTNSFVDNGAVNGTTYYYAVSAYNQFKESDLSADVAYDTPRPEGYNQSIFDFNVSPNNAGYSFAKYLTVPYQDISVDMFFENFKGILYLDVWGTKDNNAEIQDMGRTVDIYDIASAPVGGWIPLAAGENIKYAPAIVGHTYVIWTTDNHFAKVRISALTDSKMVFDWAYQLQAGNRDLKRTTISLARNFVTSGVVRNSAN